MSSRRRYLVLAICCMSLFIVGMDATIVNVALPSISRDFHATVSGLQWTVDAYLLVIESLLMLSGSVADRVGRGMIFQIGLAVFTLGSLACSLAPSLGALVAFRAVQAVGGAVLHPAAVQGCGGSMLNPVAMSIVTNTFTDPKERAKAIGFWGSTFGISVATGPVIGGALADSGGRMLARSVPRLPLVIAGTGIIIGGIMLVFIGNSSPAWYVLLSCLVLG